MKRAELDLEDRWKGTGDPLLPPRRYGLASQPDERVLDIGCGPAGWRRH